jgi:hypothetical protein
MLMLILTLTLKLEEKAIIDEMNKLGTSDKDMKRYEILKKKRWRF